MQIQTIKLWEEREDVELTAFLHRPDPMLPKQAPRPAVLVCPGGAYLRCPRHGDEGDPVAMAFAIDGYQAFVLEYSVASRAPDQSKTLYPAQLLDYGKAMLTIRAHAEEWNVDPERIAVLGFSAGGHVCGTVATRWNDGTLVRQFGVSPEQFRPCAALLLYPLTDYPLQKRYEERPGSAAIGPEGDMALFGTTAPTEAQLAEASPARHITKDCPPVFLAAATDDGLVSAEHSLVMAQALHRAGIPYELHLFRYGDHGFSLGRNLLDPCRDDKAHACAAWLPMAKRFLQYQIAPETTAYEADVFANIAFD